jgi:hypothetical protein
MAETGFAGGGLFISEAGSVCQNFHPTLPGPDSSFVIRSGPLLKRWEWWGHLPLLLPVGKHATKSAKWPSCSRAATCEPHNPTLLSLGGGSHLKGRVTLHVSYYSFGIRLFFWGDRTFPWGMHQIMGADGAYLKLDRCIGLFIQPHLQQTH